MEIYAEYFFIENLIADGAVAALTLRLWRKNIERWRFILAVMLMTLYSFSIFIPFSAVLNSFPAKILFTFAVVKILFPGADRKTFLQASVTFLGAGIALGGAVSFILYILGTEGISYSGTVYVYPASYPVILICIASSCLFIIIFFDVLSDKRKKEDLVVEVELEIGGKCYRSKAFVDTGNTLRDPFGGRPVMIGEAEAVGSIVSDVYGSAGIRLIPYSSVGLQSGALIGVEVDRIMIKDGRKEYRGRPAVLAVYNGNFGIEEGCSIILHPDILEKEATGSCC